MSDPYSYDATARQTYNGWIVAGANSTQASAGWEKENVLDQDDGSVSPRAGKKGARGLVQMIVRLFAKHVDQADSLGIVPTHLALLMWKELTKSKKSQMSLQAFMLLSRHLTISQRTTTGVKEKLPKDVFKFHRMLKDAGGSLSNFTTPLKANPFDFIVHLTLAGNRVHFDTHELLSLTELKNLGVLEIVQPLPLEDASNFPRVNDSILRQWALTCTKEGAFPLLRVLRLWGDYFTTHNSLRYLDNFPALRVYDVAGRKSDWTKLARSNSWDYSVSPRGWNLLERTSKTIEMLSTTSTYGDTSRAFSLMACWKPFDDLRRNLDVERVSGEAATKYGGVVVASRAQTKAFHDSLERGEIGGRARSWAWAYMIYAHIGRLTRDMDLVEMGMHDLGESFVIDDNVIPPRPYIELNLGDYEDTDLKADFSFHCTFVRRIDRPSKKRPFSSVPPGSPISEASSGSDTSRKLIKKQMFFNLNDL